MSGFIKPAASGLDLFIASDIYQSITRAFETRSRTWTTLMSSL